MTTKDYLRRHFLRMGARLQVSEADERQAVKIRINIGMDRSGEFFDIKCKSEVLPEVLDVQPQQRHMVLMVRDGTDKNKFLLGRDESHWFAAAVPGDHVHDVRTAIDSLRPIEAQGRPAKRQGEWFFVPDYNVSDKGAVIHRNEPLSRGSWSKPHICEELMRIGGVKVMVSPQHPTGISPARYARLIATDPRMRALPWRSMTRDADVYARGDIRHKDHKTVHLYGWHRVYINREREARHARNIAFLD